MARFVAYVDESDFALGHSNAIDVHGRRMVAVGEGDSEEEALQEGIVSCDVPSLIVVDKESDEVVRRARP
ncbi:MAG TPA: hypothetical protein VGI10_08690 [Polyangiaceae bacterium]|jgi:hypothetical protein